jgi:hypothetical protein
VFLSAVPHVLGINRARGIQDDVTWDTLRDVGLQVAHYESRHGRGGFDGAFWLWPHFRGAIFLLGRLQFDLRTIEFDPGEAGFVRGDRAAGVHIPALGPLEPAACDASFRRARRFFARHFPSSPVGVATCSSWLLDDQLTDYLPADANILRFQRRFALVAGWERPGDEDVLRFVFGFVPGALDELPQRTTLERAVVGHLRDGGHWRIRVGWLEL